MNRREILEAVAAGRLEPAEAVRLLDAPAGRARAVRLRSAYQAVDVVADEDVAEVVVEDSSHRVRREGDVLVVDGERHGRLAVRVNPQLDIDAELTGALLSIRGMRGAVRAVVQAGSAAVEDVSGALDLRVTSGSAVVTGAPRDADWRLRGESASLELVLDAAADATVTVNGRHSHVDALGSIGSGTHAIDIDAAFSTVVVRTP